MISDMIKKYASVCSGTQSMFSGIKVVRLILSYSNIFTNFFKGKGKKDDDWSDGSDVELNEVSEEEISKPISKKKSEFKKY